jgi:hypothetical protein
MPRRAAPKRQNESWRFFDQCVTSFLDRALRVRAPLVIIATAQHRAALCARLEAAGHDVRAARRARRMVLVDADRSLDEIMFDGLPDALRFKSAMTRLLDRVTTAAGGGRPRVYGEMVDLLWRQGNPDAALMLEELWAEIGDTRPLSLLYGYVMPPRAPQKPRSSVAGGSPPPR